MNKIFFVNLVLAILVPFYSQGQPLPVVYLDAAQVVEMAKSSGKPYLWVAIYVPKCAHGAELFKERADFYNKHKDKLNLVMLSILYSESNADTTAAMSRMYNYDAPFYAIDTVYAGDDKSKTHFRFMTDLNKLLGEKDKFFQLIIISKEGKMVYREDGLIDYNKVEKRLKL